MRSEDTTLNKEVFNYIQTRKTKRAKPKSEKMDGVLVNIGERDTERKIEWIVNYRKRKLYIWIEDVCM